MRFIGDADARIREDYLRILRFFRFSARFGEGAVDAEGLSASIRQRRAIARLSRERVRAEMLKLVVAPHAGVVARTMNECGILRADARLRLERTFRTRHRDRGSARRKARRSRFGLRRSPPRFPEDAERLRQRLRLANAEFDRIASAAQILPVLHELQRPPTTEQLRVLLFSAGRQVARDALFLAEADSTASPDDPHFSSADRLLAETPTPELPVSGGDLIARGVAEGPRIGDVLRAFQRLWLENGFPADPVTVERLLKIAIEAL